jgi:asparagine synthase (glutamine-hydrolysing)
MCGIAGLLSGGRTDPDFAGRMIGPLAHRGPDDRGLWADREAGVGLGHRRLSIVDLSPHGHQPMQSNDGRFVITYNGEIYNHAELRAELDSAGLAPEGGWRGHSDTEILLQAISAWGVRSAVERSVGMFAFALWDRSQRKLTLTRDRFGEKPLYYGWVGGDFLFASELKAMRAHPRFDKAIDRRALKAFASRTYIPAPLSIYRQIFKLAPGCILEIALDAVGTPRSEPPEEGKTEDGLTLSRYWSYAQVVREGLQRPFGDEHEAFEELEQSLAKAIQRQSMADVPVGAFLSGGIDSSTVVALYQKYSSIPVRTFTIGFHEKGFNEAEHAKAVAAHLGTVHDEQYVTVQEARDVIPLLSSIYDEPFADSSQIPSFLVSRFAREKVTVALSGDGGDELFGGYNRHFAAPALWSKLRRVPLTLRAIVGRSFGTVSSSFWSKVAGWRGADSAHLGGKIQKGFRVAASARSFEDIYSSFLDEWAFEESPVSATGEECGFPLDFGASAPDSVRMMYCDAITYLPDDILCKVDRASMAVSLESRVPFLDHRVAAVAARIPIEMKISGARGKQILRRLLAREVPPELFERPKAGFGIPVGEWIKGPLRPWAEELLDPRRLADDGYFDPAIVQRRWRDHLAGQRNSTPALWAILMFQAWLADQKSAFRLAA